MANIPDAGAAHFISGHQRSGNTQYPSGSYAISHI